MSTVAVVLAGGRGTRSADPSTPKLAQVIGGRSLLEWHALLLADSEVDSMVVVAGHLGDAVQDLSDALAAARPSIRVIHETEQRGTVPALALAAQHTDAEEFLVVLGDILMAFPVEDFLRQWRESGRSVAVATHPSTHPEDSDGVFADSHGAVRVIGKSTDRSTIPNLSSTGLFAITREGVNRYRTCRDFGSDVLTAAAADEEPLRLGQQPLLQGHRHGTTARSRPRRCGVRILREARHIPSPTRGLPGSGRRHQPRGARGLPGRARTGSTRGSAGRSRGRTASASRSSS